MLSEETCPTAFSFEQRVQLGVDVLPEFVFRGDTLWDERRIRVGHDESLINQPLVPNLPWHPISTQSK